MSLSRKEWLDARRKSIQASDVAAILGEDDRRGPVSVWNAKVHGNDEYDNDWLKFGRDVEGAIANLYAARTKRMVTNYGATTIMYHPDIPFLGATLDRMSTSVREDNDGPVELKHVGDFSRPDEWAADPPLIHRIQNQIQIACTNSDWGCIAGMFPGYQLAYHDQERNDNFLESIYPTLEAFWQCVIDKTPPKATGADLDIVKKLYRKAEGTTVALDGEEWLILANDLADIKSITSANKKRVKEIEAKFRSEMKDHTFGALIDGSQMTLKVTKRKGYTREVEDTEYRTLRRSGVKNAK